MSSVSNAVLIVVDALRFDRVGTSLTPNMNVLASEGESFEKCFSCSNVTDSCLTTILTGQYPTRHGIVAHGADFTEQELERVSATHSLPEILQSTRTTLGVNRKKRWHKRGFDRYLNPENIERGPMMERISALVNQLPSLLKQAIKWMYHTSIDLKNGSERDPEDEFASWYPTADSVTDRGIRLLNETEGEWFLNLHYWDTHIPYNPRATTPPEISQRTYESGDLPLADVIERISGSRWADTLQDLIGESVTVGDMIRKYETGLWHADREIGRLVDVLKEQGRFDETAFIITADHGESFIEHDILFDHHGLYDVTTHVPLIVKAPGFHGTEQQFVQSFDIAPTILDIVDVKYDSDWFDGVSLVPLENDQRSLDRNCAIMESGHVMRRRSIRTDSHRYIKVLDGTAACRYCEITHGGERELYDVESDPPETTNLYSEQQEKAAQLDARLESVISSVPDPKEQEIDFEIPTEHLEELGYI